MKIIAYGNYQYKKVAHNWALYLQQHGIENYTIYSLDQDIHNYLVENSINTNLLECECFNGSKLDWRSRSKHICSLLNKDMDILHSDLDAVWLKNPLSLIERQYDIVASTGRYPYDIYQDIGYTLCMGWIYYKPSTIVKELFQNILDQPTRINNGGAGKNGFHDQVEFNRKIFNDDKWKNLKIKILDQTIVSRNEPYNENTYVAHPVSDKYNYGEKFLKHNKLWVLEEPL